MHSHLDIKSIPDDSLLNISDLVMLTKRKEQKTRPLLPIGRTAWYDGIKNGIYPAPIKLGYRTNAWRAGDIKKVIAGTYQAKGAGPNEN